MIPEKEQRILQHCQTMGVLANCIEIEFMQDLVDARWKDPNLNNHVRKLKESLRQIKLGLAYKFKVKDQELMDNELSPQVHRLFKYFSTMDVNQLRDIIDAYEAYDIENPPEVFTEPLNQ